MKKLFSNSYLFSFISTTFIIIFLCIPEIWLHKTSTILDNTWWLTDQALAVMPALEDLYKLMHNDDIFSISDKLFLGVDLYSRNLLPIFNPFIWIFSFLDFDTFYILLHSSTLAIGIFSTYLFAREILKTNIILSLLLSILYTIHPIWREQPEIFIHAAGINFFPLLALLAIKSIKNKGNLFLIYISMLLFFSYIFGGWIYAPYWFLSFFIFYFFLSFSLSTNRFKLVTFIYKVTFITLFFIGFSAFILLPQLIALNDSSRLLSPVNDNTLKIWTNSIIGFSLKRSLILFIVGMISIYFVFIKKIKQPKEINALFNLSIFIFSSLFFVLLFNYLNFFNLPNALGELSITRFYFIFDFILIVIIGRLFITSELYSYKITPFILNLILVIIVLFSSIKQNYLWTLHKFSNYDQLNKFKSKDTSSEVNFLRKYHKGNNKISILVQMPSLHWDSLDKNNNLFMPGYLAGNLPLHYDLATTGGYVNNSPLRLVNFRKQLLYKYSKLSSSVGYIPNFHNSLLNMRFDYLFMRDNYAKIDTTLLKPIHFGNDYVIWENLKPLPLFYITDNIRTATSEQTLNHILNKNLEDTIAYIENTDPIYKIPNFKTGNINLKSEIGYKKINSGNYILDVVINKPTILIFTNLYANGWKSTINGNNTKIYPANYLYQSIYVPSGKQKIIFKYETPGLNTGKIVSIFFFAFFIYTVFKYYNYRKF
jgi:hypothetical protein